MEQVRCFIAASLSAELLRQIEQVQARLAEKTPPRSVRWTRREQLHLTFLFLGNVPSNQIEQVKLALHMAVQNVPPFELTVAGLGCFPSCQRPRVIWAGLQGELRPLRTLQEQVESKCGPFGGHQETRKFKPHLTIGRVTADGSVARKVGAAVEMLRPGASGQWRISEIVLVQSELSPRGSVYRNLASAPLAAA